MHVLDKLVNLNEYHMTYEFFLYSAVDCQNLLYFMLIDLDCSNSRYRAKWIRLGFLNFTKMFDFGWQVACPIFPRLIMLLA